MLPTGVQFLKNSSCLAFALLLIRVYITSLPTNSFFKNKSFDLYALLTIQPTFINIYRHLSYYDSILSPSSSPILLDFIFNVLFDTFSSNLEADSTQFQLHYSTLQFYNTDWFSRYLKKTRREFRIEDVGIMALCNKNTNSYCAAHSKSTCSFRF